ncbi:hypothetical protein ACIA3K_13705 [Micromonospora sp. NPDC051543]|uniref:hypothetical protein n=1 Tax=Micromonospora sp. NPDC051543 TaxID=3364287 RepID=UPI0037B8E80E
MQLRDLVDTVTGDEPPMARTVDDIIASGRRAERRRRAGFASAGAAGLVAVAVAGVLVLPALGAEQKTTPAPAGATTSTPGQVAWSDAEPFTFTFTGYDAGTLHVQDPIVASTAYQIASVYSDRHDSNDRPVSEEEADAPGVGTEMESKKGAADDKPNLWAYLTVYRPGAFDVTGIKGGTSVTVAGRKAVRATLPVGLDLRNEPDTRNKLFAWEYTDNAWAAVTSVSTDEATPSFQDLSGLVEGLKPSRLTPALVPFTVGYVPAGYQPLQIGTHAMPGLSGIAAARAGDYGGATYSKPAAPTSGLTAPYDSAEDGIENGFNIFVTPNTSSNQSPEPGATRCYAASEESGRKADGGFCNIWSADGTVVLQVSSGGLGDQLPQAELEKIAKGITVADVRDESTWTPAATALRP